MGVLEVILLLAIALALFGPKWIPRLARSLGEGKRELDRSLHGDEPDDQDPPRELESPGGPGADERR